MNGYITVLTITVGWMIAIFVGLLGLLVLWRIFRGDIELNSLLEEESSHKASMARFQFLIFTFVIAMSLFLVILGEGKPAFPKEIPAEVFALLGISGGSFLISKGVQANKDTRAQQLESEKEIRMAELGVEEKARMAEINLRYGGGSSVGGGGGIE
jgi:uncharacterized BrkB/YihY/UPF0761 family membrane protein